MSMTLQRFCLMREEFDPRSAFNFFSASPGRIRPQEDGPVDVSSSRFNLTVVDLSDVVLIELRGALEATERSLESFSAARVERALPL
jgi:hypothetical protein